MGLFNRSKKNNLPALPKKEKAISEYKIMEPIDCDLDAAINNPDPGFMDYSKLVAESSNYLFYSYKTFKDNSGGYVIRRSKANPSEKIFFGQNFQMTCVFKNYLFQCEHSGERGRFFIYAKNINNGNVFKCDWLGKGNVFVNANGFGRFYVQDTINAMAVINDQLIFNVKRRKSDNANSTDQYDIDTTYTLKVTQENGQLKPVALFNIDPLPAAKNVSESQNNPDEQNSHQVGPKEPTVSKLGRDESKRISCKYKGHEDDCPKDCSKCAISIKKDGDLALAKNDLDGAIKQYKKAVFVEPKFSEAWVNMGNAYGKKYEYNNAIASFNKAIAIDPTYGKALFAKAIILKNQGKLDEAMAAANELLELYADADVKKFKDSLICAGVRDMSDIYTLQKAIDIMTDEAYDIVQKNNMLDSNGRVSTEKKIYFKEDFARSIYSYCKKRYSSLGRDKVWSEAILASFYGSLCTTLLYYEDQAGFAGTSPFEYLSDHTNLDELDRNAENLLKIRQNENKTDKLWNVIYSYVIFCKVVISKVEPKSDVEAAVIDAAENAYVMGMLYAMCYREQKSKQEKRASLDEALKKLAASTKDYNYTPPVNSAMCYSIRMPKQTPVYYKCDICGKAVIVEVDVDENGGKEQQIFDSTFEKYKTIAKEFTQLGYPAQLRRICDDCAKKYYPSYRYYHTNNLVFSLTRKDCGKVVNSYPSISRFKDMPYKIALAFLNGADTLQKLSDVTDTNLSANTYLEYIHEVLGDISDRIR